MEETIMVRNLRGLFPTAVVLAVGLIVTVAAGNWAQGLPSPLKTAMSSGRGTYLVDPKGMTLYIFNRDKEPGKSVCNGSCAKSWPPYAPEAGRPEPVSPLTIITRDDGTKQYAYKGKPLYYYAKDSRPDDVKGDGAGKVWWVARP
jgi:predicted lipoprotein with Yx(FWY)xxD motif